MLGNEEGKIVQDNVEEIGIYYSKDFNALEDLEEIKRYLMELYKVKGSPSRSYSQMIEVERLDKLHQLNIKME